MEEYIVSARKYRPATFDTVVGQGSITTTLKNAVKNSRLAHAYLFCGPRGVGKTTCARIFAKTINCSNLSDTQDVCGKCESCRAFDENRSFNIHELDAASNNSVDDIRQLIEKVQVPPQIGRYSVFIIDEVHMLSTAAFNAFLKTLEEPPSYAIFILATTEKHKILPTIISRCQVFDFNRMTVSDVVGQLQRVAKNEGIEADTDGLAVIAQKADGAMRDALSIFDQIVAFSGKTITYKNVVENLNVLDFDVFFNVTESIIAHDYLKAMLLFNDVAAKGFDALNFLSGLTHHMRNLLVARDQQSISLLDVSEKVAERYTTQATSMSADDIIAYIGILSDYELNYKIARDKRQHIEFALLKVCVHGDEKKKVVEQLNAYLKARQEQQNASAPVPVVSPINVKLSTPKVSPIASVASTRVSSSERGDMSLNSLLKSIKSGNVDSSKSQSISSVYGSQQNAVADSSKVQELWVRYARSIESQDTHLYSLMQQIPTLENGDCVVAVVSNNLQATKLRESSELIDFLRKETGVASLKFEVRVVADETTTTQQQVPIAYTSKQKLEQMVKENSAIDMLVKRFSLDVDF